jgi:hypothetical protein
VRITDPTFADNRILSSSQITSADTGAAYFTFAFFSFSSLISEYLKREKSPLYFKFSLLISILESQELSKIATFIVFSSRERNFTEYSRKKNITGILSKLFNSIDSKRLTPAG